MSRRKKILLMLTVLFASYSVIAMVYVNVCYNSTPGIQEGEPTQNQFQIILGSAIISALIGKVMFCKYDDAY